MTWVMEEAPINDPMSLLVLYALADRAHDDGTAAWPSQEWLAQRARCSARTVRRKLKELEAAGVIKKGDPRHVDHLRHDRRPTVWNLCMWRSRTGGHSSDRPDNLSTRETDSQRADMGDRSSNFSGRTQLSYPPESGRTHETERVDTQGTTGGHTVHNGRTQLCPTNRPEPSRTIHEPFSERADTVVHPSRRGEKPTFIDVAQEMNQEGPF